MQQPFYRCKQNRQGRHENQPTLKRGREILGLAMTEGVTLVGGDSGNRHHPQRKHRARQIDQGLQGIRLIADRSREPPRTRFERNGGEGSSNRKLEGLMGR